MALASPATQFLIFDFRLKDRPKHDLRESSQETKKWDDSYAQNRNRRLAQIQDAVAQARLQQEEAEETEKPRVLCQAAVSIHERAYAPHHCNSSHSNLALERAQR